MSACITDKTVTQTQCGKHGSSVRAGVVSYLNTLPLIAGLEGLRGWEMQSAPPSALVQLLERDQVDVALCSSVDLFNAPFDAAWIASTPLACNGATHTVRLFSKVPLDEIRTIAGDVESHTSMALLQVLLWQHWNNQATLVEDQVPSACDAVLRIGDKVVDPMYSVDQWPIQVDLGAAWKEFTGLPFVFAVWMSRVDRSDQLVAAGRIIDRQYRLNRTRFTSMMSRLAAAHGWRAEEADVYVRDHIQYQFTNELFQGLKRFADECRLLELAPDRSLPAPVSF